MIDALDLKQLLQNCSTRLERVYNHYLANIPSLELKSTMEYTLMSGGKYLRPLLVYATGSIFSAPLEALDVPASAIEAMHIYSLVHDDLPAMDNADLRRGLPACHKVCGEGMAVLTGDALQTLSVQIIATHAAPIDSKRRLAMLAVLSHAAGAYGMAAGQALDISLTGNHLISGDLLTDIYRLKTGAIFSACIELGRLASKDEDEINQRALNEFGRCLGLAFQIQDDILDIEVSTAVSGKPQGIDQQNNKMTYPKLYGMEVAKKRVHSLYDEALESINYLGHKAQLLRDLTSFMLQRDR